MVRSLTVYLGHDRVGILTQPRQDDMRFTYDPGWLEQSDAIPLSRSLPLRPESFPPNRTRPFFAGILPEAEVRRKIAGILGVSEGNYFGLLERLGGECAGAVSLFPEGGAPELEGNAHHELSDAELGQIVEALPRRPLLAGREGLRLSLAGAQDKLPLVLHRGRFSLPLGNTPTTHILKPEPDRFPGLAVNEFFCLTLAAEIGLHAVGIEYRLIGSIPCVLVKRYDRRENASGQVQRVHQEDFCQALGTPPERKYQVEGGPTVADGIRLLREWATAPVVDIRNFVDGLIFNLIIGNADAHGKNYSMLYEGGERRLAPLYDLVCTLAWPELSKALAMRVGASRHINEVNAGHWRRMCKTAGLGWPMVRERISLLTGQVLQKVPAVLQTVKKSVAERAVAEELAAIISDRARKADDHWGD